MERVISIEDKIKRAEEIYARRNSGNTSETAKVRGNGNDKKEMKLVKKLIIQMIICLFIYGVFYLIKNSNYIFSEDFVNKAKEVLSYDTDFGELYNNAKNAVIGFFNREENSQNKENIKENAVVENQQNENSEEQNNAENSTETQQNVENNQENSIIDQSGIGGAIETQEQAVQLTEEEQRIQTIKNTTSFIKPVEGAISSKYGVRETTISTVPKNHTGTDIAANTGDIIKSSTDGEVVLASSEGDYGNHLKIQIGNVSVIYAHCSKLYVKQGDIVKQEQEIAEVGSTGNSTGPHLHFEIRLNEVTIDPEKILLL